MRLLAGGSCTIRSNGSLRLALYDINLRATTTTILSTRGVQIPIDLVSSTTDSIRRRVVVFKTVLAPNLDLKSEFLCQSSLLHGTSETPLNHHVRLGYLPRPRTPRIIRTATVPALSPSISNPGCAPSELRDLVVAFLLKSSRTFSPNVTLQATHRRCGCFQRSALLSPWKFRPQPD